MKKFKVVKQRDASDCGVCSMQSIIMYYGGYIPLEKLREDTLTNEEGTTAYHIVKSFQKYNFESLGIYTKEYDNEEINVPFIAHVKLPNNLFHYVVVYEIRKDYLTLMDPSEGRVTISKDKFETLFTGNIIKMIPKDNILVMEKNHTLLDLFFNIISLNKTIIVKIIIFSLIVSSFTIILSYFFKLSNNLILNHETSKLYLIITLFFMLTILKISLDYGKNNLINNLNLRVDTKLYQEFLSHILNLPLSVIKRRTTGEIVTRVNELKELKSLITEIFFTIFLDFFLALLALVALWIINSKLFLILMVLIIIYFIVGVLISKVMYNKVNQNIICETEFNTGVVENIENIDSIKNLNLTKNVDSKLNSMTSHYLNDTYKFMCFYNKIILFKNMILELGFFSINAIGFILINQKALTFVNLVTFNLLITYALTPLLEVIDILPKFNYIKVSFSKISEFLDIEKEVLVPAIPPNIKGKITISNITYSYNKITNIFDDFSLNINAGDHVFIKGDSGSGKSTLCSLIYGYDTLDKGKIMIDEKDIRDYNLNDLRNKILYVSQKENLFSGTIKENILMERKKTTNDFEMVNKICELESIVSKKSLRYNSLIDPVSNNLSGGEKQRIILARGLLKQSNILILDEALSEVDNDLEASIISNIRTYYKDKTIIYISHKDHSKLFDYEVII